MPDVQMEFHVILIINNLSLLWRCDLLVGNRLFEKTR